MNIDKENTMRALQEKPLFAKRQWWCSFGFHIWLKWNEPKVNKRGPYTYIEQFRACGCCNKVQRRVLNKEVG